MDSRSWLDLEWLSCPSCVWKLFLGLQVSSSSQIARQGWPACSSPSWTWWPFLKIGGMFALFQSSETPPDCHGLSKKMESGLTVTLSSSITSPGWVPSGIRALGMSRLFIYSLNYSTPVRVKPSLLQTFPLGPSSHGPVISAGWFLLVVKGIPYHGLFHVLCHQIPYPVK